MSSPVLTKMAWDRYYYDLYFVYEETEGERLENFPQFSFLVTQFSVPNQLTLHLNQQPAHLIPVMKLSKYYRFKESKGHFFLSIRVFRDSDGPEVDNALKGWVRWRRVRHDLKAEHTHTVVSVRTTLTETLVRDKQGRKLFMHSPHLSLFCFFCRLDKDENKSFTCPIFWLTRYFTKSGSG